MTTGDVILDAAIVLITFGSFCGLLVVGTLLAEGIYRIFHR